MYQIDWLTRTEFAACHQIRSLNIYVSSYVNPWGEVYISTYGTGSNPQEFGKDKLLGALQCSNQPEDKDEIALEKKMLDSSGHPNVCIYFTFSKYLCMSRS